jgi:predicted transcriptional regulator of viral defense system
VPRRAASGTQPQWNRLYEVASGQAGYFTAKEARDAGFSLPLLQHHLDAGRVERSQRGVFRLVTFPPTEEEGLVPTWLWSRREGTFSHETALTLHQLSDALPSKMHLTVPMTWKKRRIKIPRNLVLHFADVHDDDREWRGPIQLTKPLRTVIDCSVDAVSTDLVEQAVREGVRRRLFTRANVKQALTQRTRSLHGAA